jgi:hypothetical protein
MYFIQIYSVKESESNFNFLVHIKLYLQIKGLIAMRNALKPKFHRISH